MNSYHCVGGSPDQDNVAKLNSSYNNVSFEFNFVKRIEDTAGCKLMIPGRIHQKIVSKPDMCNIFTSFCPCYNI